ncbi:MAG: hypothetical protein WCK35_08285 [Chloroflexota bacterium]
MSKAINNSEAPQENQITPDLTEEQTQNETNGQDNKQESQTELFANAPQTQNSTKQSISSSIMRVIIVLLKFALFLAVLGLLAAILYLSWPMVYNRYILPVENHTVQIAILETKQSEALTELSVLTTKVAAIQTDQPKIVNTITGLNTRIESLETEVGRQANSLGVIDDLGKTLKTDNLESSTRLDRQIKIMKSMELLSRARLFLYQSNFGMAKQDIQIARDLLATIVSSGTDATSAGVVEVVHRLDLCLSRLPEFPVVASDDLDIAWQLLLQGTPQPGSMEVTETPSATIDITPTDNTTVTPTP